MEEENYENEDGKKQIGFDLACEHFKQDMIKLINNSNLPIAPVYYIICNLYNEVEKTYYATLNKESGENPVDICTNTTIDEKEEQNLTN